MRKKARQHGGEVWQSDEAATGGLMRSECKCRHKLSDSIISERMWVIVNAVKFVSRRVCTAARVSSCVCNERFSPARRKQLRPRRLAHASTPNRVCAQFFRPYPAPSMHFGLSLKFNGNSDVESALRGYF